MVNAKSLILAFTKTQSQVLFDFNSYQFLFLSDELHVQEVNTCTFNQI